jgi:phosphoribosylformylglycinamidine synthase
MIPVGKVDKSPQPGDLIVVIGGATGRDGIHGATFSSAELTSDSDDVSGGAVQIGNAITEKMLADVLMAARDQDLYRAVTDCGAGGLSSAIGEMGEHTGAVVQLDRVPLKYAGLTYAEIWISEAQERMVLAVPHECWPGLSALCSSEDVAATIIGEFTDNGRLVLEYGCEQVGDLEMQFLHHGRPPVVRQAQYRPPGGRSAAAASQISAQSSEATNNIDFNKVLQQMLGAWNVASKEWIIRQYDHEVQAGSVVKPLVGAANDGPGDAAVVRPRLDSWRGLVVSCGMNPHYGDWDTYHMAASAIDEAVRNCVAVGADPARIAILDNFCWGNTNRPETLGSLVRAALACRDVAFELGTPFISGKDSLNNEFSYADETGRHTISIPPTLLISALGQIEDVRQSVTMDLKQAGNVLYIVGLTRNELGGSHLGLVTNRIFADPPAVVGSRAKNTFAAMHAAMRRRLVRACHDLSEGGLAVALAEMAFAGNLGASVELGGVPHDVQDGAQFAELLLFSESNSRFICELPREHCQTFAEILKAAKVPCAAIGEVDENCHLTISLGGEPLISADCAELKKSWQDPLRL